MTRDFAKIRPDGLGWRKRWRKVLRTLPPEVVLGGGVAAGLIMGVLLCLLLYWAGAVSPFDEQAGEQRQDGAQVVADDSGSDDGQSAVAANDTRGGNASSDNPAASAANDEDDATDAAEVELEFYTALKDYEVAVDAVPMEDGDVPPPGGYLIQSGAFGQLQLAQAEQRRQQGLGLQVRLQQQQVQGRPLYRLHSGPYTSRDSLLEAEGILKRNNIRSQRLIPR